MRGKLVWLGVVGLILGTAVGWGLGGVLAYRLQLLDGQVALLRQRLTPVAPVDVLCGISKQVRQLHAQMASHCGTIHGTAVSPFVIPPQCPGIQP